MTRTRSFSRWLVFPLSLAGVAACGDAAHDSSAQSLMPSAAALDGIGYRSPYENYPYNLKGAMHVHSNHSDGKQSPAVVEQAYRNKGYTFVAMTDHNENTSDPGVPGVLHIMSAEDGNHCRHHMGVIGISMDAVHAYHRAHPREDTDQDGVSDRSSCEHKNIQPRIDYAVMQGALTVIHHPKADHRQRFLHIGCGDGWSLTDLTNARNYTAIEIFNAKASLWALDWWDAVLKEGMRVWASGGDDCHDVNSRKSFNRTWVVVNSRLGPSSLDQNEDSLRQEILSNISKGNYYVVVRSPLVSGDPPSSGPSDLGPILKILPDVGNSFRIETDVSGLISVIGPSGVLKTVSGTSTTYAITEPWVRVLLQQKRADGELYRAFSQAVYSAPIPPPPPVTNLRVVSEYNTTVTLAWSPVEGALSYLISVGTGAGESDHTIPGVAGTTYTLTGLTTGVAYYFSVAAVNAVGPGEAAHVWGTPIAHTPAEFGVGGSTRHGQVDLSWEASRWAKWYDLQYGVNCAGYHDLTGLDAGRLNFVDSGKQDGTLWCYRITARNENGVMLASPGEIRVVVNSSIGAPPPGFTLWGLDRGGYNEVELIWTAVPGAFWYTVKRSDLCNGIYSSAGRGRLTGLSYRDNGSSVRYGSTYCYTVEAENADGYMTSSTPVAVSVGKCPNGWQDCGGGCCGLEGESCRAWCEDFPGGWDEPPASTRPAPTVAVVGLTATEGDGTVELTWLPVADATKYVIMKSVNYGAFSVVAADVETASYALTGLTNGDWYSFTVAAANDGGWGPAPQWVDAQPQAPVVCGPSSRDCGGGCCVAEGDTCDCPPATPPPPGTAVADLYGTPGDGQVELRWSAVPGAKAYVIAQSDGDGAFFELLPLLVTTSYVVTGLANGSLYSFKVAGVNEGGIGPYSEVRYARPQAPQPGDPGCPDGWTLCWADCCQPEYSLCEFNCPW